MQAGTQVNTPTLISGGTLVLAETICPVDVLIVDGRLAAPI